MVHMAVELKVESPVTIHLAVHLLDRALDKVQEGERASEATRRTPLLPSPQKPLYPPFKRGLPQPHLADVP